MNACSDAGFIQYLYSSSWSDAGEICLALPFLLARQLRS